MSDPLNHSYYAATAHAWRPRAFDSEDCSCDVAVIGGGFTGLSAALACAERGFSVILIEREHVGFGASGRNGGQLIPGLRWTAAELETEFGGERADALFDLCWRDNRVKARIEKHGIDCDLKAGQRISARCGATPTILPAGSDTRPTSSAGPIWANISPARSIMGASTIRRADTFIR
jgi:hypothetical protein